MMASGSIFCLIGFRGVGKSTLGKVIANELKFDFWDSDEVLLKKLGMPLIEYAEKYNDFREQEYLIIDNFFSNWLKNSKKTIMVLGAGFVEYEQSFALLSKYRQLWPEKLKIIELKSDLPVVWERLEKSLVKRVGNCESFADLQALYNKRKSYYQKLAEVQLNVVASDRFIENFKRMVCAQ